MVKKKYFFLFLFFFFSMAPFLLPAQVLSLKEAVNTALANYGTIRAKTNYVRASEANVRETRREYLPDLSISAQQDYGTVNGQNGPIYGFHGLNVASSGPLLASQNGNAAFGAIYLMNINWDFFTFGRVNGKTRVAQTVLARDQRDLEQERFQHGIRVSAAYLNLLAAQKLALSQQNNVERAQALAGVVVARAKNGLNPGVDSSLANAEVSNAKIALTNAREYQEEQANQLTQLMGVPDTGFVLDTLFVSRIPKALNTSPAIPLNEHPLLKYYKERIDLSQAEAKYLKTFSYPVFSLFSVMQDRGSGFDYDYGSQFPDGYTRDYLKGVSFLRGNYLVGVGMVWNLTNPLRVHQQVAAQQFTSLALQDEYGLVDQQLQAQLVLAGSKIKNAMDNYLEAPVQVKAASDAYMQKTVLYRNGLANIVDVTTALFILNRAETDRDIAYNNVWQALLYKAAASGDFGLFFNEF